MSSPINALRRKDPESWMHHYEQLRRRSLEGGRASQEQAIFIDQGMMAWMRAWNSCSSPTPNRSLLKRADESPEWIPDHLQAELTQVLAGIALVVCEELS